MPSVPCRHCHPAARTERHEKIHRAVLKVCPALGSVRVCVKTVCCRRDWQWIIDWLQFKGKANSFVDNARVKAYKVLLITWICSHSPHTTRWLPLQAVGDQSHRHLKANRHRQQTDLSAETFMSRDDWTRWHAANTIGKISSCFFTRLSVL